MNHYSLRKKSPSPCGICFENRFRATKINPACLKKFHWGCVKAYISVCLDSLDIPIRCPSMDCTHLLDETTLASILPKEMMSIYLKKARKLGAIQNPDKFVYCSTPNCEHVFSVPEESTETKRDCPSCSKSTCLRCKIPFHIGLTCDEYINYTPEDHEVCRLFEDQKWKKCDKCRFWIEKNQGCNHMTCKCGHQFCYVCSSTWKTCECDELTH